MRFRRKLPAPFDRVSEANRTCNPATDGRRTSTVKTQDNGEWEASQMGALDELGSGGFLHGATGVRIDHLAHRTGLHHLAMVQPKDPVAQLAQGLE